MAVIAVVADAIVIAIKVFGSIVGEGITSVAVVIAIAVGLLWVSSDGAVVASVDDAVVILIGVNAVMTAVWVAGGARRQVR